MGFLMRLRAHNNVRIYNNMRRALGFISAGFLVLGILGFVDSAVEVRSSGHVVQGTERTIGLLTFIFFGLVSAALRLTLFRARRKA